MVRLYSTTISEATYKLLKANTLFVLPLISVSQIVCIFGQCHAHRFIDHVRYRAIACGGPQAQSTVDIRIEIDGGTLLFIHAPIVTLKRHDVKTSPVMRC